MQIRLFDEPDAFALCRFLQIADHFVHDRVELDRRFRHFLFVRLFEIRNREKRRQHF
jgi:hypothetical protein